MEQITLRLPNRYGDDVELVPVSDDRWRLNTASSYVRYGGGSDAIEYFDPPGGPMVMVGEILSGMEVVAIEAVDGETYVYMLEESRPDFEDRKKEIKEAIKSSIPAAEEQRIVIGMIGKAGSGKDTVGDYLKERHGFTSLALADTLKRGVQEMFVIPDEIMYDRVKREEPLADMPDWTVRKLLQFVGTELVRNHIDDHAWTKSLIKRYPKTGNIVVTDVRFPNEVEGIQELSGCPVFFIRVERPGHIGTDVGIKNHASEIHDLEGDFTIMNDDTLEALYDKVEGVLEEIGERLDERNG